MTKIKQKTDEKKYSFIKKKDRGKKDKMQIIWKQKMNWSGVIKKIKVKQVFALWQKKTNGLNWWKKIFRQGSDTFQNERFNHHCLTGYDDSKMNEFFS